MLQRVPRGKLANGLPVLLTLGGKQLAVRSFNCAEMLAATRCGGDLRVFAYGGCGSGDQIRSDSCDGGGPTRGAEFNPVLARRGTDHAASTDHPRSRAKRSFEGNQADCQCAQQISSWAELCTSEGIGASACGARDLRRSMSTEIEISLAARVVGGYRAPGGRRATARPHGRPRKGTQGEFNDHARGPSHRTRCIAPAML